MKIRKYSASYQDPGTFVIEPRYGWRSVDFGELWQYRDLFYFLVWRDIKSRYAQSILGVGWAVVQPVFTMIVFTIVFGNLAKVSSDGVPYAIFSYTAVVPWTYFSEAVRGATSSLLSSSPMITKIYFPRLIIPLSSVLGKLIDFVIAMFILLIMMMYFRFIPKPSIILLPFLVFLMILTASGIGMWFTALAVQYRDVKYGISFGIQLMMYLAPVVYPASLIPERFRLIYGLNPMAGVIEGFRSILLGTTAFPWDLLAVGTVSGMFISVCGILYFRRMERIFADVA